MDLQLQIVDPPKGLASALVDLRIDDQSQAGAPARNLQKHRIGPVFPDRSGQLRLKLPEAVAADTKGPRALNLRVQCITADGTTYAFINTSEVLLPSSDAGIVRADVYRI